MDVTLLSHVHRWETQYHVTQLVSGWAEPALVGIKSATTPRHCGVPFALLVQSYPWDPPLRPALFPLPTLQMGRLRHSQAVAETESEPRQPRAGA